jgi:hypothetical protein
MTTTNSTTTVPNPDAVEALALTIMRTEVIGDFDYDNSESASDLALNLVYYTQRAQRYIDHDQQRFPGVPHCDVGNREHDLNRIGDLWSFSLGFDFALQLGARIATTPFAEIDVSDLAAPAVTKHLELLERVHEEGRYTRAPEQDAAAANKAEQLVQSAAGGFIDWSRAPLTERERKVRAKMLERLVKDANRSGFPGVQFREVGIRRRDGQSAFYANDCDHLHEDAREAWTRAHQITQAKDKQEWDKKRTSRFEKANAAADAESDADADE